MIPSFRQRLFFLTAVLTLACHLSFAQTLTFCESVDSVGNPKNTSSTFAIGSTGGFVNALVTLPNGVNSSFVTYDVFAVNENGNEEYESTIRQTVQPDFTWFSKEITFHKTGKYNVYVYDGRDRLLCVGRVSIKIQ